ncbi:LysM peptidoglycan-binding domain-containing protein [Sinorhizobium sp. 8-89]|uniref:LysM peptidoglycan-binding domain-containing protein n=1 Tax=Sinorhizobium sp. 7-81 TaxID=3049087 RepID=UPI0024C44AA0|nr:LysM peptidoglycan-binding domain-containing protein [Sinorhizobium sp. 7-81]MDK1384898.1 LysM peptidoglycan-binding domain-containing protein [Sinorhizobium sp. 7-81]
MMKNKAGWVALSVLAAATALMVFVVQPNLRDDGKEQTAQPTASGGQPAETKPAAKVETTPAAPEGQAATNVTGNKAADASDPANWTVPGFDILRVEPDGSTVVAGRAQPGTKLEILNGNTIIGTADVGAAGDFAAVFDKPLGAGDHQLTLRSVGAGGATKTSEEVATVSVPKDASGQLLAMVSKPGEASRLITTPKIDEKPAMAAVQPNAEQADKPAGTLGTPAKPAGVAGLQVTAVEIEGGTMFVAGNAKPGALVRIYADDKFVGEMKADEKGKFVVDGSIDLAVGSHIIRADMLNEDGVKVAMRASVPFDRPAGTQVSAVAGPQAAVASDGLDRLKAEAGKALALLRGLFADGKRPTAEQLAAARSATEFALQSLADFKPADNENRALATAAAEASKAAADALTVLKSSQRDPASVAAALTKVEGTVGPALTRQSAVAEAVVRPDAETATDAAKPSEPSMAEGAGSAAAAPATDEATAAASVEAPGQPTTIEQAPLKESKTSVIIRRGDTLWQISRRVYGAGVRYTTIYLANREQIENPDLIRPGQVFGVPDEAMSEDESREMHRKHVKHE